MRRNTSKNKAGWRRPTATLVLGVLGALTLSACSTLRCPKTPTAGSGEKSVRPGINDGYQDTAVSVWTDRFEGESREIFRERHKIVEAVGAQAGDVIADIGAGTGLFTVLFAGAVGPGGKVLAVDIAPEFLKHINNRASKQNLSNVQTVLCREDSVELPPESIDLAFVCDTYHHFEYPKSTLASIHRALKPGGKLVVIDFERIPGKSRAWIMNHVRAGRSMVISEIRAAGFELIDDTSMIIGLEENYFLRFHKSGERTP